MKYIKILVIVILLLGLSGCANFKTIKTDESKQLISDLKEQFDDIKKIEIEMHYSGLYGRVIWKKEPSEKEIIQSFQLLKDFFNNEHFEQEILVDLFYKEYPSSNNMYPDVSIRYEFDNDDIVDRRFHSTFDVKENKYSKWYYFVDPTSSSSTAIVIE